MKIAICSFAYFPNEDGTSRACQNLVGAILAKGHRVTVIPLDPQLNIPEYSKSVKINRFHITAGSLPRFGLMGLIVSLLVSKFFLGAVPTVYYLKDVFGPAMSAVWKDTVFRTLAIIICVVAWTPFLQLQDDSGWFLLVACGMLSLALAALAGVFLGGAFGEVLSSLSTLRSKLLLRRG
jgi:hypothetical protein